jgi:hypothetical protein
MEVLKNILLTHKQPEFHQIIHHAQIKTKAIYMHKWIILHQTENMVEELKKY